MPICHLHKYVYTQPTCDPTTNGFSIKYNPHCYVKNPNPLPNLIFGTAKKTQAYLCMLIIQRCFDLLANLPAGDEGKREIFICVET